MTEPNDFAAWFLALQKLVDTLVAHVARRMGFRGDDAEEFALWVKERLWENDYAILRKWRRESAIGTYLTVVIVRLGHEFRQKRWGGRWRPSAAATRLGPLAIRLETLLYRDGLGLEEAGELLRTRGETTLSDRELAALRARLPVRERPRRVDEREVPIDRIADGRHTDDPVADEEADAEWRSVLQALDAALRRLGPEEELIVRMHFLQGYTLADVARALRLEQKRLYRVKDAALHTLRRHLLEAGLTWDGMRGLFGGALPAPRGDAAADAAAADAADDADDADDERGGASGGPPSGPATGPGTGPRPGGPPGKTGGPRPSNESCDSSASDQASGSSDSGRTERSDR